MLYGGHHERDRRAGTENVPGAAALGLRGAIWRCDWNSTRGRCGTVWRTRHSGARSGSAGQRLDGGTALPNTTNIRFDGIEGEAMVIALDLRGFAVSSGSACSSGAVEPSHVLLAMGLQPRRGAVERAIFARTGEYCGAGGCA